MRLKGISDQGLRRIAASITKQSQSEQVNVTGSGEWVVYYEVDNLINREHYTTRQKAKERASQLSNEPGMAYVSVMRRGIDEYTYYRGELVDGSTDYWEEE